MDKAAPGKWEAVKPLSDESFVYINSEGRSSGNIACCYQEWARFNAALIAAAPDMAAWIEKALPWLEAYAETMRDSLQDWDRNNVARLDALIQEATE
jgi:hypothetical protein